MSEFTSIQTVIPELLIIEPTVRGDERGFFMESYARRDFERMGIREEFVQDNHSRSAKGVLRGLHFQTRRPQGKLVRVIRGAVLDVAVDLRLESPTFGRWEAVHLSAENKRQLYVPPHFAHGFLTLEADTELLYKCTEYYDPEFEGGILWNDPALGVDWQLSKWGIGPQEIILSQKDRSNPLFGSLDPAAIFKK